VLILSGSAACGKTHLAAVWKDKTKSAASIEAAQLAKQPADKLADTAEHLVIDPVDPWFGDREAETTLFHLYNLMREQGRTLLLTTRVAPSHAQFALPDLASRLRASPLSSIASPDDTLLTALLVKLFADRQLQIGQDVLSYILPRMERSFAAARDLVEEADRLALAEKRPVSVPLIRRIFLGREPQTEDLFP